MAGLTASAPGRLRPMEHKLLQNNFMRVRLLVLFGDRTSASSRGCGLFTSGTEPGFGKTMLGLSGKIRRGSAKLLVAAALAAGLITGAGAVENTVPASTSPAAAPAAGGSFAEKWGVQVFGPYLSAGGNLVDFRYRVLDPVKAAPLTKRENKPTLLNPANGAKLVVPNTPKLGRLRQTPASPEKGRIYFMLFANTRHHVKHGDKVTITAGECKLENLSVE